MSRVAKSPINIGDATVSIQQQTVSVSGPKGNLSLVHDDRIKLDRQGDVLNVIALDDTNAVNALAGTTRANLANAVRGVVQGFTKTLQLVGVGYKANVQDSKIHLTLGFSHPVVYVIPEGITINLKTPTEIVIEGSDKQLVGHVAAEIRRYRPPEPYKGKGVRYLNEKIKLKETKKK